MCLRGVLKIIFILFVLNQFQLISCIHCGKFGFSCINKKTYRKCDVYKKSYVDNFVNLCPEKTFCNEEFKRACSSSNGNKNDDSQNDQIKDIMSTQFSNKRKSTKTCNSVPLSTQTTTSCSQATSSPSFASLDNSKKFKNPPSPLNAEKNALGKHGKCKPNLSSKHNNKGKTKHSRDVWHLNEPSYAFEDRDSKINHASDYNELYLNSDSNLNSDINPGKNDDYNKNARFRITNKVINRPKSSKHFICPSIGSFPIESDDSCFYVCFNRRRSTYTDLKAIKVCCPKSMYFNKMSHRCENRRSKHSNWRRSKLRNRKLHGTRKI